MTIAEKKLIIINEIQHTNDGMLVDAIAKLLKMESDDTIPEWRKELVRARVQEYKKHEEVLLEWNDVAKEL